MAAALDGIKVLDLSRILAGPWCTMTLADLGAEVWKIENPDGGDDTRTWMPPSVEGISTYYLSVNRSKKSVAIDLKSASGRAILTELASKADVFVEKDEEQVNGKSIMGLMMLAAGKGSKVKFLATGEDAAQMLEELEQLFARKFDEA